MVVVAAAALGARSGSGRGPRAARHHASARHAQLRSRALGPHTARACDASRRAITAASLSVAQRHQTRARSRTTRGCLARRAPAPHPRAAPLRSARPTAATCTTSSGCRTSSSSGSRTAGWNSASGTTQRASVADLAVESRTRPPPPRSLEANGCDHDACTRMGGYLAACVHG